MDSVPDSGTVSERRLRAEWQLLEQLVARNPSRLTDTRQGDSEFRLTLLETPALTPDGQPGRARHQVRIVYPRFFPSVPLELYLDEAVLHPNVHPLTGFVCLWDRHRVSNTVEHALHKTTAMLGGRLMNLEARHVMQPAALTLDWPALSAQLGGEPLAGVAHEGFDPAESPTRRRLS